LTRFLSILSLTGLLIASGCNPRPGSTDRADLVPRRNNPHYSTTDTTKLSVTDAEWKKILPEDIYAVAREGATERAFTGKHLDQEAKGAYYCAVCGNHLFNAKAKFSSSCGWPSFYQSIRPTAVRYLNDESAGMERTEVRCGRCDSHLGHVFDDGPPPTGKRYCMNGTVLDFEAFSGNPPS
jgi:peptide-methionine (R)-S-oxide reductase